MKLARFKEIFPGPAKTDPIETHKMLELFGLSSLEWMAIPPDSGTAEGVVGDMEILLVYQGPLAKLLNKAFQPTAISGGCIE